MSFVKLLLDLNHDGAMDLVAIAQHSLPLVFWGTGLDEVRFSEPQTFLQYRDEFMRMYPIKTPETWALECNYFAVERAESTHFDFVACANSDTEGWELVTVDSVRMDNAPILYPITGALGQFAAQDLSGNWANYQLAP